MKNPGTVFVGMSGGVDSSVAALLLKQRGFNVVGVFMKNWTQNISGSVWCTWEEDQRFARQAAEQIGIPLYTWDFEKEYRHLVFDYFLREYENGHTPNPDVMCNKEIKFGLFLKKARSMGADHIATGHYVRIRESHGANRTAHHGLNGRRAADDKRFALLMAKDANKDQSYFLWTLTQQQLTYCLFPVGAYTKPEVRAIAARHGLVNAGRKDSQGLCFVGRVKFRNFLSHYLPQHRGDVVEVSFDAEGTRRERAIGKHEGMQFFTVGQRQGIGIGGGEPYFIVAKDARKNTLYVSHDRFIDRFFGKEIQVHDTNWIDAPRARDSFPCMARYRYRQDPKKVLVTRIGKTGATVAFAETPRAITSGQSIVFYRGATMLGGGVIS